MIQTAMCPRRRVTVSIHRLKYCRREATRAGPHSIATLAASAHSLERGDQIHQLGHINMLAVSTGRHWSTRSTFLTSSLLLQLRRVGWWRKDARMGRGPRRSIATLTARVNSGQQRLATSPRSWTEQQTTAGLCHRDRRWCCDKSRSVFLTFWSTTWHHENRRGHNKGF
jgi:hypothetical protein